MARSRLRVVADDTDLLDEFEPYRRQLLALGRSPKTADSYEESLRTFLDFLRRQDRPTAASAITRKDILDFLLDRREAGRTETTLGVYYRSLRAFLNYLVKEKVIEDSPMTGLTSPQDNAPPPPVIHEDDLTRLLKSCRGPHFEDRRDLAILSLFADTGMRLGEMADIETNHFAWRDMEVVISGKTGIRVAPYGPQTSKALDAYDRLRRRHPQTDIPRFWLGLRGRFGYSGIAQMVTDRGKAVGLTIHPHLFRHTFAHQWLDGEGHEGDLQKLLGWSSPAMLRRYGASAATARAHRAYRAKRSPVDRLLDR
jgi:integrase/recombinase XerC